MQEMMGFLLHFFIMTIYNIKTNCLRKIVRRGCRTLRINRFVKWMLVRNKHKVIRKKRDKKILSIGEQQQVQQQKYKEQSSLINNHQSINYKALENHTKTDYQQNYQQVQQIDVTTSHKPNPNNNQNNPPPQKQPQQHLQPLNQHPNKPQQSAQYFSDKLFTDFTLSTQTLQALTKNNYTQMTPIQSRSLPYLLQGNDLLGAAKTGSGKTLAYLIPCFEKLHSLEFKQVNGTGVIIITPTRELAIQVFDVAKKIGEFHHKTIGLLIGGMNRKMESNRLQKGVNLLICTPGRLLDHLQNSKFNYRNLFILVIDEADALLRIGFEQQITDILKVLPKERQTILFSATQTRRMQDIIRLSLQNPIYIGIDDMKSQATVKNLQQGFVIISAQNKFKLLLTFIKRQSKKHKKIMIFFSSCNAVQFYSHLLNYIDIPVMDIHGKQKQQKRSTTFHQFNQLTSGILLCTDVAARGLDIPQVDWIIQYDPPLDIKEYIHRVGRTCRGAEAKGKALLFLLEQERGYLKHLLQTKVMLNQYIFEESQLEQVQNDFQLLISKDSYLNGQARSAFKSYLHAYTTYNLKSVFNVHALDLKTVGRSFGLVNPPHVDLSNHYGIVDLKIGGARTRKLKEMVKR